MQNLFTCGGVVRLDKDLRNLSTMRFIVVFIESIILIITGVVLIILSLSTSDLYLFLVFSLTSFPFFLIGFHILLAFFTTIIRRKR